MMRFNSFVVIAVTCLGALELWAKIPINSIIISGASTVVYPESVQNTQTGDSTTTQANPIVYGGVAGANNAGSCGVQAGSTATCDNCTNANTPCNKNRILGTTRLTIEFRTDNASVITPTSRILLVTSEGKKIDGVEASSTLSVNSTLSLSVDWQNVCIALGADAACNPPNGGVNDTLKFGISTQNDTDLEEFENIDVFIAGTITNQFFQPCRTEADQSDTNGGYCHLEIARGDGKVYVFNEAQVDTFNRAPGGVEYKYLRLFYQSGPTPCVNGTQFGTIVNSDAPYKDLSFSEQNGGYVLDDPTVTGLLNGTSYYFRFANVDAAGNVFFFAPDNYLTCAEHSAIPEEVVGLIDGKECFIATAAFGSSMAPQLQILRAFRDHFLKSNFVGRWFIHQYYKFSPELATKIKKRPKVKAAIRATLSPVILMAQWLIAYGLQSFILISSVSFLLGFFMLRRLLRDDD